MKKINIWARKKGRYFLLQALYQECINAMPINEIVAQYQEQHPKAKVDWLFFATGLAYILQHKQQLDIAIQPFLDREDEQIDIIERCLLRMGVWEHSMDTPHKVILNESIELAKTFGGTDSYKYINGILDSFFKHVCKNR